MAINVRAEVYQMPAELPQLNYTDVTAIVLAGGRGSRFGGQDKGWINWRGRSLIEHTLARLQPQVGGVVISCNRHLARYQSLGYPCVTDRTADYAGPLAGIAAAIGQVRTPWVLISACDTPLLPSDTVALLYAGLGQHPAAVAYCHGQHHYCTSLLRLDAAQSAAAALQQNLRALHQWLGGMGFAAVDFTAANGSLHNVNSAADLAVIEAEGAEPARS